MYYWKKNYINELYKIKLKGICYIYIIFFICNLFLILFKGIDFVERDWFFKGEKF